jgi:hypothetical protein
VAVVYESAGVTEINRSGRVGLRMDDDGVMVRSAFHRPQRFAWRDVSGFADGVMFVGASRGVPSAPWVLHVELTDGQVIPVHVTSGRRPGEHLEVVAAVRRAAARHGVPAEMTGLSVVGGKYEYPDDLLLPRLADDAAATAQRF